MGTIHVDFSKRPEIETLGVGLVFQVGSVSEPGKRHILSAYTDDEGGSEVVCSCNGYQFGGTCWHSRQIRERHGL